MNEEYIPNESKNCRVSLIRLENLEKGMDGMKDNIEYIKQDNGIQNELLAKFDTMIEFTIKEKEEEKEIRKMEILEEKEYRKEQREINKETIITLKSMNENLIMLNSDLDNVKTDITNVKSKFDSLEVAQKKQEEKGKIDIMKVLNSTLTKIISGAIGGALILGIGYYINHG